MSYRKNRGFTLIELLVVISIISLLSAVVLSVLNSAREKSRDAVRLSNMSQIQRALALYYDKYGIYPYSDYQGCGGWETTADGDFITALKNESFLPNDILDPNSTSVCGNYQYYKYPPQGDCTRPFYVLGVVDMETTGMPHPKSPGWACTGTGARNWQTEMEWVTGNFE